MERYWGTKRREKSGLTRYQYRWSGPRPGRFAPFSQALNARHTEARDVIVSFPWPFTATSVAASAGWVPAPTPARASASPPGFTAAGG
ncbi:hypothetical protein IC235_19885 [Hymenobacter sp. BT664]|uniref:Uncharacterized protein n=1 Tax=Hymenobacter montanus TaxID=2771359 RepID=A0A927GLG2_9BACT|nr:hypothetical protein [Hymenobacter montanus]MBD2770154.1 hypothetical protein [Hymenobacter montanus]